jgi:hypothetical protein
VIDTSHMLRCSHRVLVLAASLWVGTACLAAPEGANSLFGDLKAFLAASDPEYEVIFSEVFVPNQAAEDRRSKEAAALQKRGLKMVSFADQTLFYRLVAARDGYLMQQGTTFKALEDRAVEASDPRERSEGFAAGSYWSLIRGTLVTDHAMTARMNRQVGPSWWRPRAEALAYRAITLGLLVRRSSLAWDRTNFTAEAAGSGLVPSDLRGKRRVAGYVTLSNDVPCALTYWLGQKKWAILLNYQTRPDAPFWIPGEVSICQEMVDGTFEKSVVRIFRVAFPKGDLPPGSTSPDELAEANPGISVVQRSPNGEGTVMKANGRALPAAPVKWSRSDDGQKRSVRAFLRVLLGLMALLPVLAGCAILRRRNVAARKAYTKE